MRQIFLDTETTGLKWQEGDRIIEIGAVEVIDRALTGRQFHRYLNPAGRVLSDEVIEITKLSTSFLEQQPLFAEIWPELQQFLAGADQLVAHNAAFDIAFLDAEIARLTASVSAVDVPGDAPIQPVPPLAQQFTIVDTLSIAREQFPGQRNSLDMLCKRYKIDLTQREEQGHGALLDAQLLYLAYSALTAGQQEQLDVSVAEDPVAGEDGITDWRSAAAWRSAHPPLVMSASPQELVAHQQLLAKFGQSSQNGKMIWSDEPAAASS